MTTPMTDEIPQAAYDYARKLIFTEGAGTLSAELALTAPYLPQPEPDRLTVAARECAVYFSTMAQAKLDAGDAMMVNDADLLPMRAIIAREVAAAEPSDEALAEAIELICKGDFTYTRIRAALKGGGA